MQCSHKKSVDSRPPRQSLLAGAAKEEKLGELAAAMVFPPSRAEPRFTVLGAFNENLAFGRFVYILGNISGFLFSFTKKNQGFVYFLKENPRFSGFC